MSLTKPGSVPSRRKESVNLVTTRKSNVPSRRMWFDSLIAAIFNCCAGHAILQSHRNFLGAVKLAIILDCLGNVSYIIPFKNFHNVFCMLFTVTCRILNR